MPRLLVNETGATLVVMALLWAPLVGVTSLAIEYGHALKVRGELQDAAEAAAEAGARHVAAGGTDAAAAIRASLDASLRRGLKGLPFALSQPGGAVAVRIDARVATRLSAAFGKTGFTFAITATADLAAPRLDPAPQLREDESELLLERAHAPPPPLLPADERRG